MPVVARRDQPLVLRGTLTTFRRRCGKPNCRCAAGERHETPALTFTEGGRTRTLTISDADVAEVADALARYESAKGDLDDAADSGIAVLRARLAARRSPER